MYKKNWQQRALALINTFSLVLQLIFPALFGLANPAYAADATPEIDFTKSSNSFKLTADTDQTVKYSLYYLHDDNLTEAVTGEDQQSPKFSKTIFAGTCSQGDCVDHLVKRGILKWNIGPSTGAIQFTIDGDKLTVTNTYEAENLELTKEEEAWLSGTDTSPPPFCPAPTPSPTPEPALMSVSRVSESASLTAGSCILDVTDAYDHLNCTSNDVELAGPSATVIDGCDSPTDYATFDLYVDVKNNAQDRYDVGIWISTDGDPNHDGSYSGQCSVALLPTSSPGFNIDSDACGDVENTTNTPDISHAYIGRYTLLCSDIDFNGQLDVPIVTSWDNNANTVCSTAQDTVPGTTAKCKTDLEFNIPVPVPGQIIVKKDTVPDASLQSFDFTLGGTNTASFSLKDGETWDSGTHFSGGLAAGSYSVTETSLASWDQTSAVCISSKGDTEVPSNLSLQSGESITCTFTNSLKVGHIIVDKVTVPSGDNQSFAFTTTGTGYNAFNLTDAASPNDQSLLPGIYTVAETPILGWNSNASCISSIGDTETINNLELDSRETITCTITNTKDAILTLVKTVTNDNGGTAVATDFQGKIDGNNVAWGTPNIVSAGSHTASETTLTGYAASVWGGDCAANGTVSLAAGDAKTCTITNNDIQPKLTVTKIVQNFYGGTKVVADFPLFVDDVLVTSGVQNNIDSGTYTISETNLPGYTGAITGNCAPDGSITLQPGDIKSCTITNTDSQPQIKVIKKVINDNGGFRLPSYFTLYVDNNLVINEAINSFNAGTHTVTEYNDPEYAASFSGDCDGSGNVTLTVGEALKTCTITNNDIAPSLTLVKEVNNDNGGTATASAWTLTATGSATISGAGGVISDSTFLAGTYTLSESAGPSGYSAGSWYCDGIVNTSATITLALGQSATCTIINDDIAPQLKLTKVVVNDNGGNAVAHDWDLTATGIDHSLSDFTDKGDSSTFHSVKADVTYVLSESSLTGYATSGWWKCTGGEASGNTIKLDVGEQVTCSITNDDIAPTITLTKAVVNDNGGSALPDDFSLTIGGIASISGTTYPVNANTPYALNETVLPGYTFVSLTGTDCPATLGDTVTLNEGQNISCTITNDDVQPKLTVIKQVVGSTQPISNFSLWIDDTQVTSGTANSLDVGSYTVSETPVTGFTGVISGDCTAAGAVSLALADDKTCTITNTRDTGSIQIVKNTLGGDGTFNFTSNFGVSSITTADGAGTQTITGLETGNSYTISESTLTGWDLTSAECDRGTPDAIQVIKDATTTCTFTNTQRSSVLVNKFDDTNGNGLWDNGEPFLSNWEILMSQPDEPTISQTTNTAGSTTFDLIPGDYQMSETMQDGWEQTGMYCNDQSGVTITASGEAYGHHGYCGGWNGCGDAATCALWACEVNGYSSLVSYGDQKACTEFNNCNLFNSRGSVQMNWGNWCPVMGVTDIVCSNNLNDDSSSGNGTFDAASKTLTVDPGDAATCYIGNFKKGGVTVHKYEDVDGNGMKDEDEVYLSDWKIQLGKEGGTTLTSTTGTNTPASFTGLSAGSYTLSEEIQTGWTQTNISCDQQLEDRRMSQIHNDNNYSITINSGVNLNCEIGNQFVAPEMTIEKFNNRWPNTQAPGSDVLYTIILRVAGNSVINPVVTDLLPQNVTYRHGSFQAVSNINGVLSITEPTYASPGKWYLPTLAAGEVVTLTYMGDVSGSIKPGTYKDIAWAQGTDGKSNTVLASAIIPGKLNSTFVGTEIIIDSSYQTDASVNIVREEEGMVLGVTTELPATGINSLWLFLAAGFITTGTTLQFIAKKRKSHATN